MLRQVLDVAAIRLQGSIGPPLRVLLPLPLGEPKLLAHVDLLPARELELRPSQSLNNVSLVFVMRPDRDKNLTNPDPGSCSMGLAIGSSHSGLQPISSGTAQHFVDPEDMEGVNTHADVELVRFLSLSGLMTNTRLTLLR